MAVRVRAGDAADVDAAVSVFERSNLARRLGVWPTRQTRVERVRAHLRGPASWFFVADDGQAVLGMVSAQPLRDDAGEGAGPPGGFLNYLFVVPERWAEGIGGLLLDAALAEATRRHYSRVHLWTHKENERSHHLYRSRGFAPTGRAAGDEAEWARALTA